MRNSEIADHLTELGVLYELDGAVKYRVIAYQKAARSIRESPVSAAELAREGRLVELPGVGKTIQEKVQALLEHGEIPAAVKLKLKYPPSLIELTHIPGLGTKRVRQIHAELGVCSLEELRAVAEQGQLSELKGLGPKVERNVLEALEREEAGVPAARRLLSDVRPVAEQIAADLRAHPAAREVAIAGSARRWTETCKDADLIATAEDPAALVEAFLAHPLAGERRSGGAAGASIETHNGIRVDLRIAHPEAFGNLLQHFSGSKAHNVQLREQAVREGLSVSEHGIADTESGEVTLCATEAEVYERLGYRYVEPELREGRGELEAAREGKLPELVQIADIRGDLHCHTTLSDGHDTIEEMATAARARGYAYLAVTDHSASHGFGKHVTEKALWQRIEEGRELGSRLRGFKLLVGSEVNIDVKGELDYPDELLAELDWVIASVHTSFALDERAMTERVITAVEHPHVACIGHLTGRLLLRRDPYAIDVERVIEAAARTGTMLEINSNPNRRDLSEQHARLAAEAGVRIVISTDAHRAEGFDNIVYGVATARRAWLTADQVANTRGWRDFKRLLGPAPG